MTFNTLFNVASDLGDRFVKHVRLDLPRHPKTDEDTRIDDKFAL